MPASAPFKPQTVYRLPEAQRLPVESWATRLPPLAATLAIGLIFLLLAILLWLLDRDEKAGQRDQLIRDTLWVEQALQFQLDTERTRLSRLVADIAQNQLTPDTFTVQARQFEQIVPEIIDVLWLNADKSTLTARSQSGAGEPAFILGQPAIMSGLALSTGAGSFTQPWQLASGRSVIAHVVPILRDNAKSGWIIAVFALDKVLAQHVPWWIAEKRAVSFKDGNGRLLAARSKIEPNPKASSHNIEMALPLRDMTLTLTSYWERSRLIDNGLVAAMVVLGVVAALGIAARERQLRKRRAAERALDNEQAFRRAMEDSLRVGIRARDLDGRLLHANQAFCRMVGYSVEELVGKAPPMPYWVQSNTRSRNAFMMPFWLAKLSARVSS